MSDAATSRREKNLRKLFLQVVLVFFFCATSEKFHLRRMKTKTTAVLGGRRCCDCDTLVSGRNKSKLAESKVEIELHLVELLRADGEKHIRHTAARSRQEKCQGHSCYNFSLCAQFNFSNRAQEKRSPKASETSRFRNSSAERFKFCRFSWLTRRHNASRPSINGSVINLR